MPSSSSESESEDVEPVSHSSSSSESSESSSSSLEGKKDQQGQDGETDESLCSHNTRFRGLQIGTRGVLHGIRILRARLDHQGQRVVTCPRIQFSIFQCTQCSDPRGSLFSNHTPLNQPLLTLGFYESFLLPRMAHGREITPHYKPGSDLHLFEELATLPRRSF